MSKPKLTPWIDGDIKPTRVGVYERFAPGIYAKWDGAKWCISERAKRKAADARIRSPFQCNRWRGLASDPSKGAK